MKEYTIAVECKGCQEKHTVKFTARPHFDPLYLPLECKHCLSELGICVKRGFFNRQVQAKVSLLKHTEKLLDIIKERRSSAQDNK